jgi:malonyl CoA-acyl carrier protein transacylase/phosphopantetheinyl transferase
MTRERMTREPVGPGLSGAAAGLAGAGTLLAASETTRGLLDTVEEAAGPGPGSLPPRPGSGPVRLAIVAPTPERLALARKVIERGQPWRGRNDIWFTGEPLLAGGPGGEPGRLAFLFPGFEPGAAGGVDEVATRFGLPRPAPCELGPAASPDDRIIAQAVNIVTTNQVLAGALTASGVQPDLMAGHSLGEWTAMVVSGMCGLEQVDRFFAPVREGRASFPDVAYAALGCGAEAARAAIAGLPEVFLSHDNCPHQCVVCGRPDQVEVALARLSAGGILGQVMAFRSGFHTPLLRPCLDAGRAGFEALAPRPPAVPVWSATSVAPYPDDPAALRRLVVDHLLEPVRFRELTEALYANGVRAFVQVGAGSLTGFVQDTLGKRPHLAIAAQIGRQPALPQLARVLAALWVEGAEAHPRRAGAQAGAADPRPGAAETPAPFTGSTPARPHPVFAAFEAGVAEAAAAMQAVLAAWAAGDPTRTGPASATGSGPASATWSGPASATWSGPAAPAATTVVDREFSLATMPELRDHCLFRQAPGWPDAADAFPVVPMTRLLDLMGAEAQRLAPGRVVTAITGVRAHRWLAVAPPVTVPVERVPQASGRVRVGIGEFAEGLVELAGAYPAAPGRAAWTAGEERAPEADARTLYEDGWMFHGPGFQGVESIDAFGSGGIRGTLRALPAAGALLDAAGQLAGHWAQAWAHTDRLAFPAAIEAVRFYGPHPAPGQRLTCTVTVRSFTSEWLKADLEVAAGDQVWAGIEGWTCRRFATDDITWPAVHTRPSEASVGEHQPGGWCLVTERWPDLASMEYTMRRYLTTAERAELEARSPRARRTWLLGRIAAKDAARGWFWRQGHGPIWPGEFLIGNEASGRPWIRRLHGESEPLTVSIAHVPGLGVAITRPAATTRVGIDVEDVARVAAAAGAVAAVAFTGSEEAMLDRLTREAGRPGGPEQAVWMTRFWTAKEAVAKALGTGLSGRPRDFVVTGADGGQLLVTCLVPGRDAATHRVHTRLLPPAAPGTPGHVVAWTEIAVEADDALRAAPAHFVHEEHRGGSR